MEKTNLDKGPSTGPTATTSPSLVEKIAVDTQGNSESLLHQLTNNKLYIYIIIAIIVLALIGYYLYTKHFSKSKSEKKVEKLEENSNLEQKSQSEQVRENRKHILSPDTEYYLLDRNGNPVLMNQHFSHFLQGQTMTNNQTIIQRQPTSDMKQQRPKLTHPNEEKNEVELEMSENDEDENLVSQDLTLEEIQELKKQLEIMQRKQSAPITAQNDEDGDEANF
jgi:FtsZ-interacting cell division protein ZipA